MRILICGGRDYRSADVWNWLEYNAKDMLQEIFGGDPPITCIIHGGARGADEGAGRWGEDEHVPVRVFRADWKKHGKAAGPIRNQKMLDEGKPDFVIAFPGGRGTADMVRRAEAAGVPVYRVREAT